MMGITIYNPAGNPSDNPGRGPGFQITEVWLFVVADDKGADGICGMLMPDGTWMPLVCADRRRYEQMLPIAQGISDETNKEIRIVHLGQKTLLGVIRPRGHKD